MKIKRTTYDKIVRRRRRWLNTIIKEIDEENKKPKVKK